MVDSILTRLSYLDSSENREVNFAQEKADLLVYSFKEQLSDPILIASQLAGAGVYGLFRGGILRLFKPAKVIIQESVELGEEAAFLNGVAKELKEVRTFETLESSALKSVRPIVSPEYKKFLLEVKKAERSIEMFAEWKREAADYRGSGVNSLAHFVGMTTGSEAFDLTRRSLISLSGKGSQYPNLWKWENKRDGMSAGMAQSVISVGMPLLAGFVFGDYFFRRDFKPSWATAALVGSGVYLLHSLMNSPSYKRNDICWDSHLRKDTCQ